MKLTNSKILITGGASGIGLGLTERFVQQGNTVIIVGRRESLLNQVAARLDNVIPFVADLSDSAGRQGLFNWVQQNHPDLEAFINNAGIQNWMSIHDADFIERAKAEIVTNIEAPLHLTALFSELKSLKTLVNVTSGLAFVPASKIGVYSATKAFLHSFTLTTRYVLQDRGIEVIELIPPALDTDLGGTGIHSQFPPVSGFVDSVFNDLEAGKTEITYLHSTDMAIGGPEVIKARFDVLNPPK
ncbi:cytochrome C [Flavobacterium akiainvivens]|uniref:Cytochrome C n=1 Tax=Flavobacterium akiainvivens TaxID=1202724 RepID=A0A0M9VJD5_9FLAO|nr:SDR family NAD(P)-dependent oxidoreductase [Flavobacterium akiainvivens]KOS07359.1 cytochrome C [Flavobacterium akiainvivens]SFQ47158.1 uncharacterized oxidoreductase [Flavobacterium akiainvivens]